MASMSVAGFLAQVENLDPVNAPRMREIFTPKGVSRVASSRNFVWIMSHVLRGLHPAAVSQMLLVEQGEAVSAADIRDYTVQHVPPDLVGPHLLTQYLRRQPDMDEIDMIDVLRKLCMARLMLCLDQQPVMPALQSGSDGAGAVAMQSAFEDLLQKHEVRVLRLVELTGKLAEKSADLKIKTGRPLSKPEQQAQAAVAADAPATAEVGKVNERGAAFAFHLLRQMGVVGDEPAAPEADIVQLEAEREKPEPTSAPAASAQVIDVPAAESAAG